MPSSGLSESVILARWAEEECRHLDLIASWEDLMSIYDALRFDGPDSDEQRLDEFKFIIAELNRFLTRMRNGLARTRGIDDAIEFLVRHVNTMDVSAIEGRKQIAYNKMKQQWVRRSIMVLNAAKLDETADEGKEDDD